MPIPKPHAGESQDDYIGRCMSAIGDEYDDKNQAVAICHQTWRDRNRKDTVPATRTELMEWAKDDCQPLVRKAVVPEAIEPLEERVVRFVISTGAVDRDNDTIDPKGWDLKNYLANPVVLWAHDYRQLPVGRARSVTISDGKLVSECEFAEHDFAQTVYAMVKGGFLRATSVGFRARKYTINEERHGLDFTEQELMEYSIVPVPANPEALNLEGAKAAGIDIEPIVGWAKSVLASAAAPGELSQPQHDVPAHSALEEKKPKPCGCLGGDDEHQEGCQKPKAPPAMTDPDENGKCGNGYEMGEDGKCHLVQKQDTFAVTVEIDPKTVAEAVVAEVVADLQPILETKPTVCRICEKELPIHMPRLKDDLGVVCAPCFVRAAAPPAPPAPVETTPKEADDASVIDLDDGPPEDVAVELADGPDDQSVVDISPEDVRAALRSAISGAMGTVVREQVRAALARARGRVD